jgi:hypothetical protein
MDQRLWWLKELPLKSISTPINSQTIHRIYASLRKYNNRRMIVYMNISIERVKVYVPMIYFDSECLEKIMNWLHKLWLHTGELLQLQLTRCHFYCSDILIFLQIIFKVNINLPLHFASAWRSTCKGNNWNDWESCMKRQCLLEITFYCLKNVPIITTWDTHMVQWREANFSFNTLSYW